MTDFVAYDPTEPVADGRTIVEASAGTGKTYTIAAAVTRLVAVEGVELDQILVVTFTRAATAELKSRVRERMVDTLRMLDDRDAATDPDGHMQVLLDADPETKATAAARLGEALTHFDRAQIFTIHGFAQRLMGIFGFRSRLSADLEQGAIDQDVLAQVASDLVVGRFADNPDGDDVLKLSTVIAIVGRSPAPPMPGSCPMPIRWRTGPDEGRDGPRHERRDGPSAAGRR